MNGKKNAEAKSVQFNNTVAGARAGSSAVDDIPGPALPSKKAWTLRWVSEDVAYFVKAAHQPQVAAALATGGWPEWRTDALVAYDATLAELQSERGAEAPFGVDGNASSLAEETVIFRRQVRRAVSTLVLCGELKEVPPIFAMGSARRSTTSGFKWLKAAQGPLAQLTKQLDVLLGFSAAERGAELFADMTAAVEKRVDVRAKRMPQTLAIQALASTIAGEIRVLRAIAKTVFVRDAGKLALFKLPNHKRTKPAVAGQVKGKKDAANAETKKA
jgi:hypothetical protein